MPADGYRIEARIVINESADIVKVASGALFREEEDWFAFQVVGDRARLQRVRIGESNGIETEIISGLAPDDLVILHPTDKVQDRVRVRAD